MYEYAKNILSRMNAGQILTKKGDKYSPHTLTNYQNAVNWLQKFEAQDVSQEHDFDIDTFFEGMQIFLINQGMAKNSVTITLQNIQAVLRHEKAISLPPLKSVKTELTTAVYTDEEELRKLADLDLAAWPGYDRVRDAYVMHANIGLRFGDFQKVISNIRHFIIEANGRQFFKLKTGKAGEDVVIPINQSAAAVLEKRDYDFGKKFSITYYNKGIKWVAHAAGFTQPICKYRTQNGRMTETWLPKYELMSSHTARRTFATNAWLTNVPESDIMKITAHRSVVAFRRYLRADALQKARSLAALPFFQ